METLFLVLFGFAISAFGTIVGAGGGFLLLPVLLTVLRYPPAEAAGTTQVYVLANALSATIPYLRQRRVDLRSGLIFCAAGIPGVLLGAATVQRVPVRAFESLFAVVLIGIAARMLYTTFAGRAPAASGTPHRSLWLVVPVAFAIGFMASLFGIGGGPIQVPALIWLFALPVHAAAATSIFILSGTAIFGSVSHLAYGHVLLAPALVLSLSGIAGAQLGVRLSRVVAPKPIVVMLALASVGTAARLLV